MDDLEKRSRCRICGWHFSKPAWDEDGEPSYWICPSCGGEVGNEDWTLEHARRYRAKWVAGGLKWQAADPKMEPPPPNWDPMEQMKHIPQEWQ